jgi:hypothetical protein
MTTVTFEDESTIWDCTAGAATGSTIGGLGNMELTPKLVR